MKTTRYHTVRIPSSFVT